jgi:hypothetical protein
MTRAAPATRAYFDWESAGIAAPSGVMQLEGLHLVSPDNRTLALTLVQAYIGYAYGWVMDAWDVADLAGDEELARYHRTRAYLMYSRARDLALHVVRSYDKDFSEHFNKPPAEFMAYLNKRFGKDEMPALYWLMMAWSSAVNNSYHAEEMSDMTSLLTIADWIAKRDPAYEDAGALVVLGGYQSTLPAAYGGHPEQGKAYFERAAALTGRKNHIVLLNYAVYYASNVGDKPLYISLLKEIIAAPDQGTAYRLGNKVARRRAIRALERTELRFFDD